MFKRAKKTTPKWVGEYKAYKRTHTMRSSPHVLNELKYIDYEVAGTSIQQTVASSVIDPGTFDCLGATAQADTATGRIGRQCLFKSLHIRGWCLFEASAGVAAPLIPSFVRLLVVQDTQTNGAQLDPTDVLDDPASTALDSLAFQKLENQGRFKILRDFRINQKIYGGVGSDSAADYNAQQVPWECKIPLKMRVNYTNISAVVGSISDNSIHVIAIREGSTGATLGYIARMRFYT